MKYYDKSTKKSDICGYKLPKFAKCLTKIPNKSENIPKSFRGTFFFETLCKYLEC